MEERFAFLTEWYDPTASLVKRYQLFYYPSSNSVEMYDIKNQRMFLRRSKYDGLNLDDLFVGNRITIFSRQLSVIDYGDPYTSKRLGSKKERTVALIKPDAVSKIGDILEMIYAANLILTKAKMTRLTWFQAADFYAEHQSKSFYNNLVQFVSSGPVVAMELMGNEAISVWRKLLGPTDSSIAKIEAPASVRAKFGTDNTQNAGHGSDSVAAAARESEFFFPTTVGRGPPNTAVLTDSTCCIIKPHALSEGLTGKIINSISAEGYKITALQMFSVDQVSAEEFFEIYKGIVTDYTSMVTELCSGPCMVLEVQGKDVTTSFRDFCGPSDPDMARHLRPTTLRALYGKDRVKNAVHCTDLPEDSPLEVQYFFKNLDD
ncbi:nucleoside diphosphate kinase 7 [Synchiropus splendidus]|uniref:nucleoside diphosphate kinase 7 n=1 Tax=Synchiropus splendidus TaxID=270530 RepID=UPI00237E8D4D|nr:nucleoside diphosphate kinase 7 [Synchiropus splendidus]